MSANDQSKIPEWKTINQAITDLIKNQDIKITTEQAHVVAYIYKALADAPDGQYKIIGKISHDLRSPLAPIKTVLDILERTKVDPDTRKLFQILERQVASLAKTIEQLTP